LLLCKILRLHTYFPFHFHQQHRLGTSSGTRKPSDRWQFTEKEADPFSFFGSSVAPAQQSLI
jgi:hypothetical protein